MKLFSIESLGHKASTALVECINAASSQIKENAKKAMNSDAKKPVLRCGFSLTIDLKSLAVVFALKGTTRWMVDVEDELELEQGELDFGNITVSNGVPATADLLRRIDDSLRPAVVTHH